jgi:hypothetical protein
VTGDVVTGTPARGPHTPGVLGHVVWIALSTLLYGPLLVVGTGGDVVEAVVATFFVVAFGWIYAVPVGVLGALAVDLTCRSVPRQGVHVVAAAVAGVVAGALFWGTIGESTPFGPPALLVGVAAALGRAAVVPLVDRRRAFADDDFPATV